MSDKWQEQQGQPLRGIGRSWVLSTAVIDAVVDEHIAPPSGVVYKVALVVKGERYEQGGAYDSLIDAEVVALAQAQAVVTRGVAQLRCSLVEVNRRIAQGG